MTMISPDANRPWECSNTHDLLVRLIGYEMGLHPERHIEEIRSWRENIVEYFDDCFLRFRGNESVLEIGSGCGFTSRAIARRVKTLCCVDISESFLQFARAECAGIPNIQFHCGSYIDLGFIPGASIDAVIASAVLIHADMFSLNLFFSELARVLRPGGRVVFDFLDANRLSAADPLFAQHTNEYRRDPSNFPELCKWNSGSAIVRIAEHYGFVVNLTPQDGVSNTVLLAVFGRASGWRLRLATAWRTWRFDMKHPVDVMRPPKLVE
jgi:SAM-dependent methyltransferase